MTTPANPNPSAPAGDENTGTDDPQTPQPAPPEAVMPDADPDALRAEIRRLRDENAAARQRTKRADVLAPGW